MKPITKHKEGIPLNFYQRSKSRREGQFLLKWLLLATLLFLLPSKTIYAANENNANQFIRIETTQLPSPGQKEGELATSAEIFVVINSEYPIKDIYYMPGKISNPDTILQQGTTPDYISTAFIFTATKGGTHTIYVTDYFGNSLFYTFEVKDVDTQAPTYTLTKNDMFSGLLSTHVYDFTVTDDLSGVVSFRYQSGYIEDTSLNAWEKTPELLNSQVLSITTPGIYTFRTEDALGNVALSSRYLGSDELRAVWVSYLEYETKGYTFESFRQEIDAMFEHIADMNMNAVIVHVRPFGDAMYQSQYFPWSRFASGTQGVNPGFDPLAYMVEAAHKRGLQIHAWINPYRITNNTTNHKTLSSDNPARKWLEDGNTQNDRNVIAYGGKLYYNPAKQEVQDLIVNGIAELVSNYDIDGIHFDDYFYPSLGKNYASIFDHVEYKEHVANQLSKGQSYMGIANWRRENVSKLIRTAYSVIKSIDPDCEFGVSPGGFYRLLKSDTQYYVDYERWMSEKGYLDYICPQIYWSNQHATYPYEETLDHWLSCLKSDVKVYVGIAAYKAGTKSEEAAWYKNENVLAEQISYARNHAASGFMFFRYDTFVDKANYISLKRMLQELQK